MTSFFIPPSQGEMVKIFELKFWIKIFRFDVYTKSKSFESKHIFLEATNKNVRGD